MEEDNVIKHQCTIHTQKNTALNIKVKLQVMSEKSDRIAWCLFAFLLGLLFDPQYGAVLPSETSVNTPHYMASHSDDNILHSHHREDFKPEL
jgi:hypothetical protein